jgi:hypothetical protein
MMTNDDIKVSALYAKIDSGCQTGYNKNILNHPIIKIENEGIGESLTPIKDRFKNLGAMGHLELPDSNEGSNWQAPTSTELMNPYDLNMGYESVSEHVNTMYVKESTLFTKNTQMMNKDGCNKLQLLVNPRQLTTMLTGDSSVPEDDMFMDDSQNESLIEIICDITQINKISGSSITKLLA